MHFVMTTFPLTEYKNCRWWEGSTSKTFQLHFGCTSKATFFPFRVSRDTFVLRRYIKVKFLHHKLDRLKNKLLVAQNWSTF